MKERFERLKTIRALIKINRIDSQEQLLQLLAEAGITVTQATLSRDLKYLKVGKVSDGNAGYYYTIPSDEERREAERHSSQDFLRGYVSIDWNSTMVIVRTFSGHTDSVCLAIDNMCFEEVLGTIAGRDNVVFVALKDGVTGEDFVAAMKKKIPELEVD
jgi:transcriptional regulator of arginine metabolism